MTYSDDHHLREMIADQIELLEKMVAPNGAVSASPNGHYRAHWVRDGLYVLTGAMYAGLGDLTHTLIRTPFSIFKKHRARIQNGIRHRPGKNYQYLNARYHPQHFDEFKYDWGHNQLDMIGLFLFLVAKLPNRGVDPFHPGTRHEDSLLINQMTRYLETLNWWSCADYGVWEEVPKQNSSSLGAVLAGMTALSEQENDEFFFNEDQLQKGREALDNVLPNESKERECDLAQLSLIWPYNVLSEEQTGQVLGRIEERLVRDRGVIRYVGDAYYNAADERRIVTSDARTGRDLVDYSDKDREAFPAGVEGSEAQWPLGLAWLSIAYSKLAKKRFMGDADHGEFKEKARVYLEKLQSCAVPCPGKTVGYIPELYVDGQPNINTPLTWATAFAIVAAVAFAEIEDRVVPYSTF